MYLLNTIATSRQKCNDMYVFGWCRGNGPKEWRCLRVSQCILYTVHEGGLSLVCALLWCESRTRDEMAPIFRQDVKGGGRTFIHIYIGVRVTVLQESMVCGGVGAAGRVWPRGKDARFGGGVKSWGMPTGKSPDYFTDCRRGP